VRTLGAGSASTLIEVMGEVILFATLGPPFTIGPVPIESMIDVARECGLSSNLPILPCEVAGDFPFSGCVEVSSMRTSVPRGILWNEPGL
jgi:hypothetical protein